MNAAMKKLVALPRPSWGQIVHSMLNRPRSVLRPDITKIRVVVCDKDGAGAVGAKQFGREDLPYFAFHNQRVHTSVYKAKRDHYMIKGDHFKPETSVIEISKDDGSTETHSVSQMSQEAIMDEMVNKGVVFIEAPDAA